MKFCKYELVCLCALGVTALGALPMLAQQASAEPSPSTVIAVVDGHQVTFGEVDAYFRGLGDEVRQKALANPKEMIKQYATSLRLLEYAKAEKLQDKSPYKEAIETSRRIVLIRAALDEKSKSIVVSQDDQKQFYEQNKDRFTNAKVQVIYLGFVADPAEAAKTNPGRTYRTQDQAKAKIEEIRNQIKTREDFVKMVKQDSEDEASKNNNGDFGTIRKSDNVPPDIKQVIFSLKKGEISGPVAQRNGFYLFRVDDVSTEDYDAVKDSIYTELKDKRARAWMEEMNNKPVELVDKPFFDKPAK